MSSTNLVPGALQCYGKSMRGQLHEFPLRDFKGMGNSSFDW